MRLARLHAQLTDVDRAKVVPETAAGGVHEFSRGVVPFCTFQGKLMMEILVSVSIAEDASGDTNSLLIAEQSGVEAEPAAPVRVARKAVR